MLYAAWNRQLDLNCVELGLRTTDGGKHWVEQISGTKQSLYEVSFADVNNGMVVGYDGIILRTTDGGNNWVRQSSGTRYPLYGVFCNGANTGTVVGLRGAILRTTSGGVTLIGGERIYEVPTEFLLAQNYPNPFNPTTVVSYQLPVASEVRLGVYDVLGREVSVLVNERREAGHHEATFNGSNLASGVYFYRLRASDFVQSKRLVLLK